MVRVVVSNHSEQHVRGNFVAASPLCVAFSRRPEDHAPRIALREKIRAQREQRGSKENFKKTKKIKKTYSGTLLNAYGWGQSLVILFVFFGFLIFSFFELFLFFFLLFLVVLAARVPRCVFRSAGRA